MLDLLKPLYNLVYRKKSQYTSGSLTQLAWKRFNRNGLSMAALAVVLFCLVVALAGYLITPDSTPMANRQVLELATKKPGFSVSLLKIPLETSQGHESLLQIMLYGKKVTYRMVPVTGYNVSGDTLYVRTFTGDDSLPGELLKFPPGSGVTQKDIVKRRYLLGTDQYGRDVLSRLMIGTRVSLAVGLISVLISLVIGIFIGSLGGFFRGRMDNLVVWLINVIWSIPTLLLVIAITFALGRGFWQIFIAVGLTMWVEVARVTRGQILSIREKEFVEAARALGFSNFRIIFHHILPNITGPIIVISAANFASAILIEAGLSFLGIGVQPPMPSWGSMIRENYSYLLLDAAYLAVLPGLAISLLVLAFMIIGNGLRDALDIKATLPSG